MFSLTMIAKLVRLRWLRIASGLLVLVLCISLFPLLLRASLYAARRSWKNKAIPVIAKLASDKDWIGKEIKEVATLTNDDRVIVSGWLTDKLILMENGEWLVYQSHCSKAAPHYVEDIFWPRDPMVSGIVRHFIFVSGWLCSIRAGRFLRMSITCANLMGDRMSV